MLEAFVKKRYEIKKPTKIKNHKIPSKITSKYHHRNPFFTLVQIKWTWIKIKSFSPKTGCLF